MSIYTFGAKQLRHGVKRLRHGAKRPRKWDETTWGKMTMGPNNHLYPLKSFSLKNILSVLGLNCILNKNQKINILPIVNLVYSYAFGIISCFNV